MPTDADAFRAFGVRMNFRRVLASVDGGLVAAWTKRVIVVGSIVVLALSAARLFWLLGAPEGAVARDVGSIRARPVSGSGSVLRADLSILTRINPFSGGDIAEIEVIPEAPETALNLTLSGLRAQSGEGEGSAVIKTPDNLQKLYAPGEEILDGVFLEQVLSDRVLLKKNGRFETLFLTDARGELSVIEDQEPRQQVDNPDDFRGRGSAEISSIRAFLDGVRLDPVREGETTLAYTLLPRDGGAILQSAGLQPGDSVVELNGVAVSDINGEEFVEDLQSAAGADLTVERDGERFQHRLIIGRRDAP